MSTSDKPVKNCKHICRFPLWRGRLRNLRLWRVFAGGRIDDLGRLPRYALFTTIVFGLLWGTIFSYLHFTPPKYTSEVSLILPGSGASNSITLDNIGQAASFANSAFSSPSISPTQTYKRLLSANRVLTAAAQILDLKVGDFGRPQIKLVDETSLIHFEMQGASPEAAQAKAAELLNSFQQALTILRDDDLRFRQETAAEANLEYANRVQGLRREITQVQGISDLTSFAQYAQLVTNADALQGLIHEVEANLRHAEDAVTTLSSKLGIGVETAALTLKLRGNTKSQSLALAVSEQAAILAITKGQYGARHPLVQDAIAAHDGAFQALLVDAAAVTGQPLDVLRADARVLLDTDNSGLLVEILRLNVEKQAQQAMFDSYVATYAETLEGLAIIAPYAATLDDLERDYQVAEAVFASAMARMETTKSDVYASYPLVQVLEDASLPRAPSSPNRLVAIAAGIGASMMFLVALILAWVRRPIIAKILNARRVE